MTDPIREALERLVAADRFIGEASPQYQQARDAARAALAAAPEAARSARSDHLPPKIGHVFSLAGIICDALAQCADGEVFSPTTLAEKILSDPRSQWAPAQEDKGHD